MFLNISLFSFCLTFLDTIVGYGTDTKYIVN